MEVLVEEKLFNLLKNIKPVDLSLKEKAYEHLDNLTKPPRSLGKLEEIAARIFAIQEGKVEPYPARIYTCAGDHGVVQEGVSPYPQEVTRQMVLNFLNEGAAINVLCKTSQVDLKVVDVGVKGEPFPQHKNLIQQKIKSGTGNIAIEKAMRKEECLRAIFLGIELASNAQKQGIKSLGTGEMGIGNTTSSTALYCAFLNLSPEETTGAGAGLDNQAIQHKIQIIKKALNLHSKTIKTQDPLEILSSLGGLEIACLTGLILGAALYKMPIVIDGFISTAAFVCAYKLEPKIKDYAFFSHLSAEKAHKQILEKVGAFPLLHLDMRLGEGTGAALALFLLQATANIFNNMATFEQAGVASGK